MYRPISNGVNAQHGVYVVPQCTSFDTELLCEQSLSFFNNSKTAK